MVLQSGVALLLSPLVSVATPAAALPSTQSPQLTLPAPTGPHRTGTVSLHLVDPSRPDPWVPSQPVRELMIQIWYPAAAVDDHPRAPYMTPVTVRAYENANTLPSFNWPVTDTHLGAAVRQRRGGWPVVLYSPGLGDLRSGTTALVEDLASHGYVVVTIDHVHDAAVVELPDGRVETSAIPPLTDDNEQALTTKVIESRVADVRFVLDQLTAVNRGDNPDHEHRPLPRGLHGTLDLRHVGMFGHSDGGSTTAHALHVDSRITAGVNLDGTLWTPQARAGSDRPLMLFGRQYPDAEQAASWSTFSTNQHGPKHWFNLTGSEHATFNDFAALIPQLAPIFCQHRGCEPEKWIIDGIGTIDGQRAVAVERAYLRAYFDTYLRHHRSHLLNGPSPHYPEVVFTH